ncbi:ABC transporter substrate-binding protein [Coralliovum pocilloporae]|uniref:ABC transporter substrate-binding protein n=1 Tax=Coralliovum pocilloporae TaxID=3066369 RepID=UPI003306B2B4
MMVPIRSLFALPSRLLGAVGLLAGLSAAAYAVELQETPTLSRTHDTAKLPGVEERVPSEPMVVDLSRRGRSAGKHGGDIRTLIPKSKDARLINVWGYARLVGYDEALNLKPDILKDVEVEEGRIFTLHLREGHKWSDGHPFTAEDFRYYWEDIVNNKELTPPGPESFLRVDGEVATFEVLSPKSVRYSWSKPNPVFLQTLAQARPPFIYRPAHYLKQFHINYGDPDYIAKLVKEKKSSKWTAVHHNLDRMYRAINPDLPSLQPWITTSGKKSRRFVMIRNPYYHRVDTKGRQLPYVDKVIMTVADGRLIATKSQAGEVDLQARSLAFSDVTVLKSGEAQHKYKTRLWPIAKGAHIALYPNLTTSNPVWRELVRDKRFRHALSLGIDRRMINQLLFFGLATESNNTVLPQSPLYKDDYRDRWARYDKETANRLLDEMGLDKRRGDGIRLLPNGEPLEIIVETAGESKEQIDILALIGETWRDIGVKLFAKPSQRDVMRDRAFSGQLVMSVWSGYDNGIPTPASDPGELVPISSEALYWPRWGEYFESHGTRGEKPDLEEAVKLVELYKEWKLATGDEMRMRIWHDILEIHAENTFSIGLVSLVRQPVVASNRLKNVPVEGIYGWDPGAHFGLHRMDEFWLEGALEVLADDVRQ